MRAPTLIAVFWLTIYLLAAFGCANQPTQASAIDCSAMVAGAVRHEREVVCRYALERCYRDSEMHKQRAGLVAGEE